MMGEFEWNAPLNKENCKSSVPEYREGSVERINVCVCVCAYQVRGVGDGIVGALIVVAALLASLGKGPWARGLGGG
jgi:hypothetical protein